MLTFDKLKITTNISHVNIIDKTHFNISKGGNLIFKQMHPFLLTIKMNYNRNEVFLEFTGKVLGNQYPQLISLKTIHQCFENINKLGIIHLDIDAILTDSDVCSCDVTKDVKCRDIPQLCSYLRNNIKSYRAFVPRQLRNGNFIVDSNVTTKASKKRLTIYDKYKEMSKVENNQFMNTYQIAAATFEDKCRFELNLNSKEQIRKTLKVSDTSLMNVLQSQATPISDFIDEIVANTDFNTYSKNYNMKDYQIALVLKDCNYDIEQVEAKLRELYAHGNNMTKILKPYRDALNKQHYDYDMKSEILGLLVST